MASQRAEESGGEQGEGRRQQLPGEEEAGAQGAEQGEHRGRQGGRLSGFRAQAGPARRTGRAGPGSLSVPAALLVGRPHAGGPLDGLGARAVHRAAHHREDGALDRGGQQDLAPAAVPVQRVGRVVLVPDRLPGLAEGQPGQPPLDQPSTNPRGW